MPQDQVYGNWKSMDTDAQDLIIGFCKMYDKVHCPLMLLLLIAKYWNYKISVVLYELNFKSYSKCTDLLVSHFDKLDRPFFVNNFQYKVTINVSNILFIDIYDKDIFKVKYNEQIYIKSIPKLLSSDCSECGYYWNSPETRSNVISMRVITCNGYTGCRICKSTPWIKIWIKPKQISPKKLGYIFLPLSEEIFTETTNNTNKISIESWSCNEQNLQTLLPYGTLKYLPKIECKHPIKLE